MKPTPVRRILWVVAILVLLGLLMAGLARAEPVQITDDRGRVVTIAQPPQRIASLLPSLTESVCALGECQRIVGVDRFSNWPDSVKKLPQLGGYVDPSIEDIVALKPDLVLLSNSTRASERLEALGLTVLALEPKTHADVRRVLLPPPAIVGLSTHNDTQAHAACAQPISYLAIGPVFATTSKTRPDPIVGLDGVRMAVACASPYALPVVAIGGITLERAPSVIAAGASSVAIISDLLADDLSARVRAFVDALG